MFTVILLEDQSLLLDRKEVRLNGVGRSQHIVARWALEAEHSKIRVSKEGDGGLDDESLVRLLLFEPCKLNVVAKEGLVRHVEGEKDDWAGTMLHDALQVCQQCTISATIGAGTRTSRASGSA